MTFNDVIQKAFVDDFFTSINIFDIIVNLVFAMLIGIYIYFVYKLKNRSGFYSKDFNIVLVGLPIITSAIVLSMQSNLVISLGMVGALSIVRFRNAVKNSIDLLFLFWSISIGIICGGKLYSLALILSLVLSFILILLDFFPSRKESSLLIINAKSIEIENELHNILKKKTKFYKVKSKSIHGNNMDLIIEIRSNENNSLVVDCSKIKNVENVNLLSHDGDDRL